MLIKWMDTLFAPKPPRQYTGRHRAARTSKAADFPAPSDNLIR
jgi:hypothetical protein